MLSSCLLQVSHGSQEDLWPEKAHAQVPSQGQEVQVHASQAFKRHEIRGDFNPHTLTLLSPVKKLSNCGPNNCSQ